MALVIDLFVMQRINISTQQTKERRMVSTISFTSPELKDSGYYVCVASNPVDQESWEVVFDVYPFGSHFVDKGFGDVTVDVTLDTGEDEDGMCKDETCDDAVFFDIGDGDVKGDTVNPGGAILLAVVAGAGVLIAAVVVVISILLTRRCVQK